MRKKIAALLFAISVLLNVGAVGVNAVAQTDHGKIILESVEAKSGDNVSIKVKFENNPGIWGMDLKISYDKTNLTLTSVDNGDFFKDSEWTRGDQSKEPYTLSYEADGLSNIVIPSGTLATLNFKVSDTAAAGDYTVTASYRAGDIINTDFEDINPSVTNGKINVKAKPVMVTGISLDKSTISLVTGEKETLVATVSPTNATNKSVTWTSSDSDIATVDSNGLVTALKKGSATITATTAEGGFSATCSVSIACGHTNTTVHQAVDSTCTVQGNNEYSTCDDCGVIVSGSDAKLPLAQHTFAEKAEAKYLKTAATCKQKAIYYTSCSVCGLKSDSTFEYGDVDATNHVGETYLKNQKEATCYEKGYTGDVYCHDCDKKISDGTVIEKNAHNPASVWSTDENKHWKECQTIGCGNIADEAPHSGGEATCTKRAVCSVCSTVYGEINENNHKNTEIRNASEPTCTTDGYTGDTYCKDCNAKLSEGSVVPASHKLVKIEAVASTHDKDGNIEYYACSNCEKLFKDSNANDEIKIEDTVIAKGEHKYTDNSGGENHWKECNCGSVIEKAPHEFGEWNVVKEATENKDGLKERVCSVCGHKSEEDIPAIGTDSGTGDTENKTPPKNANLQSSNNKSPETGVEDNAGIFVSMLIASVTGTAFVIHRKEKIIKSA